VGRICFRSLIWDTETLCSDDLPHFEVKLFGPGEFSTSVDYHFTVSVKYENTSSNARSVTFRNDFLDWVINGIGFSLLHHTSEGAKQIEQQGPDCLGQFLDDIPEYEDVSTSRNYQSLGPGESFEMDFNLFEIEFAEGFEKGHIYSYRFNGGHLGWWDWGTKTEFQGTLVRTNSIADDNRPQVFLPTSGELIFTVIL
jgi:hypothetical protein